MSKILECKNLTKRYGDKVALKNINLEFEKGKIIGLLGPNGSGKTTFIKLINGLLTPTEGEIYINGEKPSPNTKLKVSYLPDKNYLNDWMKVEEIIDFFKDFYENFDSDKAYRMLNSLNIDRKSKLKTLSKGTKEKVQLILVMSRDADLYLLDEPIAGVDPAAREYIIRTIINNYNESATVLICTHLISDIEPILDHVIFIKDGAIDREFDTEDLRNERGISVDEYFREVYRC